LFALHPKTPSSLSSFKSRLVLPFWYRLTQVVLERGRETVVRSVCISVMSVMWTDWTGDVVSGAESQSGEGQVLGGPAC